MCSILIVYFGFSVLFSIVAYQFRLGALVFVVVQFHMNATIYMPFIYSFAYR